MPAPETGATSDRLLEAQALALLGPLVAALLGFLSSGLEGGLVAAGRLVLVLLPLVGFAASGVAAARADGDAATLHAVAAVGFLVLMGPGLHVWSAPPDRPGGACERTGVLPEAVGSALAPEGPAYLVAGVGLVAVALGGAAMTPHRRAALVVGLTGLAVPVAAFVAAPALAGCPAI